MLRLRVSSPGLAGLVGLVGFAIVACSTPQEETDDSGSALDLGAFDKNAVLDDATLNDATPSHIGTQEVQAFFDKTPYWAFNLSLTTTSALSTYREGGKLASEIVTDAAKRNGINPIAMLTALETEQSLVSNSTLDTDKVKLAFRCVCPSGPECRTSPEKYVGFTQQAECYASTLRAGMDAQKNDQATKEGWQRGKSKQTNDKPEGILVTPKNTATAALYSYTPVVGEDGGGESGLGGVSKYHEVFQKFATALSYDGPKNLQSNSPDAGPAGKLCTTSAECEGDKPVCDTTIGQCVACASDFGASGGQHACATAAEPACSPTGACVVCNATNSTACAASNTTPACNPTSGTCGCPDDATCGSGRVCNSSLGPGGMCVDGCHVASGKDSCAPAKRCSDQSGGIGTCQEITCATAGCPSGGVCNTTASPAVCVECLHDSDCGGNGRTCDLDAKVCLDPPTPTQPTPTPIPGVDAGPSKAVDGGPSTTIPGLSDGDKTPSADAPREPPSGHEENDREAAGDDAPPEPEFAPTPAKSPKSSSGCNAGAGSADVSPLLAAFAACMVLARRKRR